MTTSDPDPDTLVWQRLHFPQPLPEAAALALLRQWAAWPHVTELVLEARSDRGGVRYLVGVKRRFADLVRRSIEQLVGSSLVTSEPSSRHEVDTARRVALTTTTRPLQPIDAVASVRSILSSLTAVSTGEHLVIQLTLGRSYAPSLPPVQPHTSEQSLLSRVLIGLQPDEQPDARAALGQKLAQHAFAAVVRIGVSAATPARRKNLLVGLASAMATGEAPGVHLTLRSTSPHRMNQPLSGWPFFTSTTRLTIGEIGRLAAWPISDKDEPFPGQPPRHPKPVRPSAAVMSGQRAVAAANAPGVSGTIGYGVTDALRHTWVIGPNGVGKSTLLLNLICQDLDAGRPVVVIEPKDLVADVLRRIPASRVSDVVVLDPLDEAPVGINPLHRTNSAARGSSPEVVADSLFGTFHSLYGEAIGPRSSDILRNCLDVLARRDDASLIMLPLLLTNPGFRRSLTQHAMRDDPFSAGPFWQWFDALTPEATANIVAPLSNKIRPLLDRHLRAVLAQRQPRFNVRQVLTENKVLLVPLQKGVIGPEAAQLLGAIVVAELWQAIRERAGTPEASRTPVMIYIDEVQDYLRLPTDLGDALATARSLKAGFHVAHQYSGQLPKSMLDAFMNNARSRVCFQLGSGDAKSMAAGQSVLAPEDFSSLPAYHVYASLTRDNTVQPWASGVTLPAPPVTSDPDLIRAHSRAAYGQPLDEIEAGFAELLTPTQPRPASGRRRRQAMSGPVSGLSRPDDPEPAHRFAAHFTSSQSLASSLAEHESGAISAATDAASASISAPVRGGRRPDLHAVSRSLSERDWAILQSVAEHRFLTVRHLHALHFHGLNQTSGLRIAQRVLARLRRLGLLATLTRRVGGVRAGSGGLIHYLDVGGDRLLRLRQDRPAGRRFHEPSDTFLRHTLAIADTRIHCLKASRARQLELLRVQLEPAAWRRYAGLGGATLTLKPDLYVETAPTPDSEFIDAWFIEVDLGSEQIPRLIRKCRECEAYRALGIEQDQTGGFPLVVWSLTDRDAARARRRRQALREAIAGDRSLTADLFRIVAPEELVALLQRGGDQ